MNADFATIAFVESRGKTDIIMETIGVERGSLTRAVGVVDMSVVDLVASLDDVHEGVVMDS